MFGGYEGQWLAYCPVTRRAKKSKRTTLARGPKLPETRRSKTSRLAAVAPSKKQPFFGCLVKNDVAVVHPLTYSSYDAVVRKREKERMSELMCLRKWETAKAAAEWNRIQQANAETPFAEQVAEFVTHWSQDDSSALRSQEQSEVPSEVPPPKATEGSETQESYSPKGSCDYVYAAFVRHNEGSPLQSVCENYNGIDVDDMYERPDLWMYRRMVMDPGAIPGWIIEETKASNEEIEFEENNNMESSKSAASRRYTY